MAKDQDQYLKALNEEYIALGAKLTEGFITVCELVDGTERDQVTLSNLHVSDAHLMATGFNGLRELCILEIQLGGDKEFQKGHNPFEVGKDFASYIIFGGEDQSKVYANGELILDKYEKEQPMVGTYNLSFRRNSKEHKVGGKVNPEQKPVGSAPL
ncbi:hypothetical protein HU751_005610 [Pseudomonas sp. BW13M1]|uniref:Uncharacterized protein n=1 Tax=Pseudomonas peradeniyensis TaxID=2745488 RepID=A0A923GCS9_9PSED|nr:hypothetical protein [Pseudomonas peradeniyensis]MBV4504317.1 hypothetical protein [Pseudomonas peradeniyensis]